MSSFHEPSREIPLVEETDVLVAGGGPAGSLAAVAAARQGVRVRLLEAHGALGGIWTVGCLPHIIESNKGGLLGELLDRLQRAGAGRRSASLDDGRSSDFDVETFKVVLEEMVAEAGVATRLYTSVAAAYRDADGRIETLVSESKSGREAWRAMGKPRIDGPERSSRGA